MRGNTCFYLNFLCNIMAFYVGRFILMYGFVIFINYIGRELINLLMKIHFIRRAKRSCFSFSGQVRIPVDDNYIL